MINSISELCIKLFEVIPDFTTIQAMTAIIIFAVICLFGILTLACVGCRGPLFHLWVWVFGGGGGHK